MIRNLSPNDYDYLIERVNSWWGGREVKDMLPRLFFDHFHNTSFVALSDGRVVGFVVGFLSNCMLQEAYIHFTGVDPDYRNQGVASSLYKRFIELAKEHDRQFIKCVTSPSNRNSLAYHHKMGFVGSAYDVTGQPMGLPQYDGPGNDRVLLTLSL